jgi:co-chaperonin GroES (HSP10)
MDWRNIRPIHEWIVVKADPRVKKTKGGIELPDSQVKIERVMEGTGRILRVGNMDEIYKSCAFALEPGMRICYRGFLKDTWRDYFEPEDNCDIFLLHAKDILGVLDEDAQMGHFS